MNYQLAMRAEPASKQDQTMFNDLDEQLVRLQHRLIRVARGTSASSQPGYGRLWREWLADSVRQTALNKRELSPPLCRRNWK